MKRSRLTRWRLGGSGLDAGQERRKTLIAEPVDRFRQLPGTGHPNGRIAVAQLVAHNSDHGLHGAGHYSNPLSTVRSGREAPYRLSDARSAGKLNAPTAELIGTIDPTRAVQAERAYVTAFFDAHLKVRPARHFDGLAKRYPEVEPIPLDTQPSSAGLWSTPISVMARSR